MPFDTINSESIRHRLFTCISRLPVVSLDPMSRPALITCLALAVALAAWPAQEKKKKHKKDEDVTQVLELPKDPPAAVVADADRLLFQVSPLSGKGLLSQQLREAVRWVLRQDRTVIRLRAFVAGTGDTRRVQAIVSEAFSEKHLSLPVLTVVQIGALPLEGAQVLLEAVLSDKKPSNPNGLAFISGQGDYVGEPLKPVMPFVEKATGRLQAALKAASIDPGEVLRVGCYLTSLEEADKVRAVIASRFPRASVSVVQPLRAALQSGASCDAVARLSAPPAGPLKFMNPPDLEHAANSSAVALVAPGRVAVSGAQLAFGATDADARLAFERLGKSLEQVTASYDHAAVAEVYSLSRVASEEARKVGAGFFDKAGPPAVTALPFEGLPSMDASFAIDVIVLLSEPK
jgi:enamine deaminase RidA (YjgF/YER057c/UK114 family)